MNFEGLRKVTKEKSNLKTLLSLRMWSDAAELILYALGSVRAAANAEFEDESGKVMSLLNIVWKVDNQKLMDEVWAMTDGVGRVKALANLPAMDGVSRNDIF